MLNNFLYPNYFFFFLTRDFFRFQNLLLSQHNFNTLDIPVMQLLPVAYAILSISASSFASILEPQQISSSDNPYDSIGKVHSSKLISVWNETRNNAVYFAPVTLRGNVYNLILDTGSTDLWVYREGFQCISSKITREPRDDWKCNHGPTFKGDVTQSQVPNRTFAIQYGSGGFGGEFIGGNMSYENVTVAGVTVTSQQVLNRY
jgi:hypothetical protein